MARVVHFRTKAAGTWRLERHHKRGYWRVLEVLDPNGSKSIRSKNVIRVLYESPEGILGVTPKSKYYLDMYYEHALKIANSGQAQNTEQNTERKD